MHRRSLFLATSLVLLLGLTSLTTQSTQIEWKEFGQNELSQILETPENYHLILFHNGTCEKSCSKTQALLTRNAEAYRGLSPGLKVHIVNFQEDFAIPEDLGLDEEQSYGLFGISRGIPIRLDSDDESHDLDKEIKGFFSKHPVHLDTVGAATKVAQKINFVHFYYGAPTASLNWAQFEVSSRLSEAPFYYSNSSEVAALFGATRKRSFQTFDVARNHSIRLLDDLVHENIERFVATSTRPVPQKFDLSTLRQSTSNLIPVIVYRATDSTRQEYLNKLFSSVLQDFVKNYYHVYELSGSGSEEENTIAEFCSSETTGVKGEIVCIIQNYNGKLLRYIFNGQGETKGINTFISAFIDGKLTPYFRAETIKDKFTARVRNLNSYTWEKFLTGFETDTTPRVLLYYKGDAPESTHKAFEGASLQVPESDAKFGRVNIDSNELTADVDSTQIYFEEELYTGALTAEDIATWVKTQVEKFHQEQTAEHTEDL